MDGLIVENENGLLFETADQLVEKMELVYYDEKISTLKNIQIIGHDILNNYYSYKMESDNLCKQYESTQIGLPQDFDYSKIK